MNHAHLGVSVQNKYFAKLHLARAQGRNVREEDFLRSFAWAVDETN